MTHNNILIFFQQESLDQLNKSKGDENQIDSLKNEISRIKGIEEKFETLQVNSNCFGEKDIVFVIKTNAHSGVTKILFCSCTKYNFI